MFGPRRTDNVAPTLSILFDRGRATVSPVKDDTPGPPSARRAAVRPRAARVPRAVPCVDLCDTARGMAGRRVRQHQRRP
jgi:hypothetical protein